MLLTLKQNSKPTKHNISFAAKWRRFQLFGINMHLTYFIKTNLKLTLGAPVRCVFIGSGDGMKWTIDQHMFDLKIGLSTKYHSAGGALH